MLDDSDLYIFHADLARYNVTRIAPGLPVNDWESNERVHHEYRIMEGRYLENLRKSVQPLTFGHEGVTDHFIAWFESLAEWGPGQHHPLLDWLENKASHAEMEWFLTQEAAGEVGFEDLIAYSQIKLPTQPKLECARNYWDEMGRGKRSAMHGPLLERMVRGLQLRPSIETTVWESLALGNAMLGMALTRRYTFHSLGALGVIELIASQRAAKVVNGMRRLGMVPEVCAYFNLHAMLDVHHSQAWIQEVIRPLAAQSPLYAQAIAEGALMRLQCGQLCFDRYSRELGLDWYDEKFDRNILRPMRVHPAQLSGGLQ